MKFYYVHKINSLGIVNLFTLHKLNLLYKEIWVVFVATKFEKSRHRVTRSSELSSLIASTRPLSDNVPKRTCPWNIWTLPACPANLCWSPLRDAVPKRTWIDAWFLVLSCWCTPCRPPYSCFCLVSFLHCLLLVLIFQMFALFFFQMFIYLDVISDFCTTSETPLHEGGHKDAYGHLRFRTFLALYQHSQSPWHCFCNKFSPQILLEFPNKVFFY